MVVGCEDRRARAATVDDRAHLVDPMTPKLGLAFPTAILLGFALALAPACHHDDGNAPANQPNPNGGAMQKAGASVDQAATDTKEKAKEGASAAGSAVEKAGEKMKPND